MKKTSINMETDVKYNGTKKLEKDGVSKTVRVEQVDNGFIVTVEKNWRDKKDGYQYEEKKYISKTNPFENNEGKESSLSDSLETFLNGGGSVQLDIE